MANRLLSGIPLSRYAKTIASSVGACFVIFLASFLLTGAMIGALAERALFDYCGDYDNTQSFLPLLPVHELTIQKGVTHSSSNYMDIFINAMYSANSKAQDPSIVGVKVFHGATWDYDGYFLPLGLNANGQESLLYVDTTFPRFVSIFCCAVSSFLFCLVAFGFRCRVRSDSLRRDKIDVALESSFANASHELKTPLMTIRGYAESIRDGSVEEDFALERIVTAVDRMTETVDGILKISHADSGLKQPVLGMWDVREIVYDEARMVEDICQEKGMALDIQLPQPLVRPCDESMTGTVVRNVLGNAIRHAEAFVRVTEGRALKGEIELVVENDGQPPSPDTVAHAFDRFYKGDCGSTGIGLALSKEYMELMGGEIEMIAMPFGTRVRVRL